MSAGDRRAIVLVGFMATGKTTVGRIVAERLGRPFVDLDAAIEETAGKKVADIFRSEGEPAFRRHENAALLSALGKGEIVIATGGGAACREENLQAMLSRSFVVALSAPPAEVLKRAGTTSGRPLLDGEGGDDKLAAAESLLKKREPFYERAHLRVDTIAKSPDQVASEILTAVHERES